ncbi:MAG: hypothetical protein AAF387_04280 [Pseudomonadota bacterium]
MKLLDMVVNYQALAFIFLCHGTTVFAHEEVAGGDALLIIFHMLTAPDHVAIIILFTALVFVFTRKGRVRRSRARTKLKISNRRNG